MSQEITVQFCPCGHVDWSRDPKHLELDQKRRQKGFLDALTLPSSECDECKEAGRRREQEYAYYDMD